MKPDNVELYFNDEVLEILSQNLIHIVHIEPMTNEIVVEPSFRLQCDSQRFFAKFSLFNRFTQAFLDELLERNQVSGNNLLLPIISENIESLKRQLNIYEWVNGINLRTIIKEEPSSIISTYGFQCGNILRKIHMKMDYRSDYFNNMSQHFDDYMKRLEAESFSFLNQFDYCDYFEKNSNILQVKADSCFVHMDFRPKNLLLCDDKIIVVDIDSCRIGNPWMDFYDKALSLYEEKEIFNAALLRAYFEDNIPNEFWEFFKVLSVYSLVENTAWLLHKKDTKYIRLLESYLWENYDGFKRRVPKWIE